MNEFTTVFDLTSKSVRAHAMLPLIFSFLGIIGGLTGVIFHKWVIEKLQMRIPRSIFGIIVLIGLLWLAIHIDIINYAVMNKAKDAQIVEGVVHVTHRQSYHGRTYSDRITVDGQPFEIDQFNAAPGYKDTIASGGVLGEGAYVRIHHCDGAIVKIEIKK